MTYVTTTAPCVTFAGPEGGIVCQKEPSGQKTPRFAVDTTSSKAKSICRIAPDGSRAEFAASTSAVTGRTKISFQGTQITMDPSWEGLQYSIDVKGTPIGDLKWRPSSSFGHQMEMTDGAGVSLARYKTKSRSGRELTMEIFVKGDDFVVDMIVACALGLNGKIA